MNRPLRRSASGLLAAGLFIVFSLGLGAQTIHTVDNNVNSVADFTSVSAAIEAADPGDVIYVMPSPTSYGSVSVSKADLTIYGGGYMRGINTGSPEVNTLFGSLSIPVTSTGVTVSGCFMTGNTTVNANNTTLTRNFFDALVTVDGADPAPLSGIVMSQNYHHSNSSVASIQVIDVSGMIIRNSFILNHNTASGTPTIRIEDDAAGVILDHNTIYGSMIIHNTTVRNCLQARPDAIMTGNQPQDNNVIDGTNVSVVADFWGGGVNGIDPAMLFERTLEDIFVDPTAPSGFETRYEDDLLAVLESSPYATSSGGTPVGMFGGADPYVLSGLPALPTVLRITAPTAVTTATGLEITIEAESID